MRDLFGGRGRRETPEADLQKSCADYLFIQYPHVLFDHPALEGRRSFAMMSWLKRLGTKPGMPDLMIYAQRKGFCGLAIELKVPGGKSTELQIQRLADLRNAKWYTDVIYSFDDFKRLVDDYLITIIDRRL